MEGILNVYKKRTWALNLGRRDYIETIWTYYINISSLYRIQIPMMKKYNVYFFCLVKFQCTMNPSWVNLILWQHGPRHWCVLRTIYLTVCRKLHPRREQSYQLINPNSMSWINKNVNQILTNSNQGDRHRIIVNKYLTRPPLVK